MKKFIISLSCFATLLVLMIAIIEVALLYRPNIYAYKHQYMEAHLNDIKVLLLGSSHIEEAVKPEMIGEGTFNLAISARLKEYDAALAEMYVPRMDSLKVLVMPVDYTNFFFNREIQEHQNGQGPVSLVGTCRCMHTKYMGTRIDPIWYWSEILNSKLNFMSRFWNNTQVLQECDSLGYVKLDKTEATILKGKTTTLTATVYPTSLKDKSVTWESSNTKVATVSSAGKVKGVKAGTATITCTSNATGLKATCTVNVVKGFVTLNKTEACVQKGKTVTLKATVTPETLADKSVTWESSDPKIATVTSEGKVKGVKYGTATITCTSVATSVKATCQVTVGKVIISMSEFSLKRSRETILIPILYPTDLADKSVTWESSDTSIATVNEEGRVKGIKAGTATITCTSVATGLKGTCTVTVLSTSGARSMIGDDDELTGLKELESPAVAEPFDVYDQNGRKVLHQVTSLDGLPDGIYIVNGKKLLKKKL